MPRWTVRRSRCATASATTAARPRRRSPSPPTARGFTGGTVAFGAVSRAAPGPPAAAEPLPVGRCDRLRRRSSPTGDGRVFALGRSSRRDALHAGPRLVARGHPAAAIQAHGRFAAARHRLAAEEPADRRRERRPAGDGHRATRSASVPASRTGVDPRGRLVNFDELEVQDTAARDRVHAVRPARLHRRRPRRPDRARRRHELARPGAARRRRRSRTDITGVAFDGRTPLLATTDGLYVGEATGDAYVRDDDLRARMAAAGLPARGAHGRDRRRRRHRGRRPLRARQRRRRRGARPPRRWSCTRTPSPPTATRTEPSGRSCPRRPTRSRCPMPVEPDGRRRPAGRGDRARSATACRYAPSPTDAVVLRETADGWIDLDRSRFQRSGGRDLPDMTPNTRAILVDGRRQRAAARRRRPTRRRGPPTATGRTRRPSAAWRRRAGSNAAPSRPSPARGVRGRPRRPRRPARCASPSAAIRRAWTAARGAGGQGYAPDTHLQAAIARVRAMVGRRRRPRGAAHRRRARLARRRAARPRRSAPLPRAHPGRRRADVRVARPGRRPGRRRGGVRVGVRHRARAAGHG